MSRMLRLINARRAGETRVEYWDRDELDPTAWRSYQHDEPLKLDELLARADDALGVEVVLTLPKPKSKPNR